MICFVWLSVFGGIDVGLLFFEEGLAFRCQGNPICTDISSV